MPTLNIDVFMFKVMLAIYVKKIWLSIDVPDFYETLILTI